MTRHLLRLAAVLAGGLLNRARSLVGNGPGQLFLERAPEHLERPPRRFRIRTHGVAGREHHVLVVADDGEGAIEVLRPHARVEQRDHVGVADRARLRRELTPGTLAERQILDLVELGESR